MEEPVLVGLRSGRRFSKGYVCYVGYDVTADDIIEELGCQPNPDFIALLDDFLSQASQFKFDNVIEATLIDGRIRLTKLADRPVQEQRKTPLP